MKRMKIAIYPGSFRPWHRGHTAVLWDACEVFDKVIVAVMKNPKKDIKPKGRVPKYIQAKFKDQVLVVEYEGLLRDLVTKVAPDAIVRGLRNAADFEAERTQQYWNEDLGVRVPTYYVISPREYVHLSSSAVRAVEAFTKDKK